MTPPIQPGRPGLTRRECVGLGALALAASAVTPARGAEASPGGWDSGRLQVRASLDHPTMPWAVAFSPDGSLLASAGFHNPEGGIGASRVRVWETATWSVRSTFEIPDSRINRLAFAPDGKSLVAAGLDRATLVVADVATGKGRILLGNDESGGIQSPPVASPDGSVVATAGPEGLILWDSSSWKKVQALFGTRDQDLTLVAAPVANWKTFGGWLYAMSGVGVVSVIIPAGAPPNLKLAPGTCYVGLPWWRLGRVRGVARPWASKHPALSADGKVAAILAVEEDSSARIDLYDVEGADRWRKRSSIDLSPEAGGLLYGLAFTPDGRALVAGSADRVIRRWEVANGRELPALAGHGGAVNALAFSPDGRAMAAADSLGRSVKIWSPDGVG